MAGRVPCHIFDASGTVRRAINIDPRLIPLEPTHKHTPDQGLTMGTTIIATQTAPWCTKLLLTETSFGSISWCIQPPWAKKEIEGSGPESSQNNKDTKLQAKLTIYYPFNSPCWNWSLLYLSRTSLTTCGPSWFEIEGGSPLKRFGPHQFPLEIENPNHEQNKR